MSPFQVSRDNYVFVTSLLLIPQENLFFTSLFLCFLGPKMVRVNGHLTCRKFAFLLELVSLSIAQASLQSFQVLRV